MSSTNAKGPAGPLMSLSSAVVRASHDLKGPTHHVQAYVRLLRDDGDRMDASRRALVLDRLLSAADNVAAQLGSLTLWAKAEQGRLSDLAAEQAPLQLLLDEFAASDALALSLAQGTAAQTLGPVLLLRLALLQLAAWARDVNRVGLAVQLACQTGEGWSLTWQGPMETVGPPADLLPPAPGKGAAGRAEIHLGALCEMVRSLGGDWEAVPASTDETPEREGVYRLRLPRS